MSKLIKNHLITILFIILLASCITLIGYVIIFHFEIIICFFMVLFFISVYHHFYTIAKEEFLKQKEDE